MLFVVLDGFVDEQADDDKKIVLQVKTGQNGAIESVSVG